MVAVGGSRSSFEWLTLAVVAVWVVDVMAGVDAGPVPLGGLASAGTAAPEAGGWWRVVDGGNVDGGDEGCIGTSTLLLLVM